MNFPTRNQNTDVQHDAHVRTHEAHMRAQDIASMAKIESLLHHTGWVAAEAFTDGTLDQGAVGYRNDIGNRHVGAYVTYGALDFENQEGIQATDVPLDQKILSFHFVQRPTLPDDPSSEIKASLQVVPMADDHFRILFFGVHGNAISLEQQVSLLGNLLSGMDDFMTRVATRRGMICKVTDTTDIPAHIDALIKTGYRIRKSVPGEEGGSVRESRDQEVLRAIYVLARHGIQLAVPQIGGQVDELYPFERLTRRDDGQPYFVELEKRFAPLKADNQVALLERMIDQSFGIMV